MGLKGNLEDLRALKASLRAAPLSVAHDVAKRASPVMTKLSQVAYDGGDTVYDVARPRGVDGDRLSLVKTGATRRQMVFVSNGTIVRVVLGPKYAKYLIGKYDVLPNGALPAKWRDALKKVVAETKVDL